MTGMPEIVIYTDGGDSSSTRTWTEAARLLKASDVLVYPIGFMANQGQGSARLVRVHGAYVADHEVHKVVAYLKQRGAPDYHEEVLQGTTEDAVTLGGEEGGNDEADPLYDSALRIVTETRRASVSGIQRRLKIGYNRAARMIEEMERAGVVSPLQTNGSREVLAAAPPED